MPTHIVIASQGSFHHTAPGDYSSASLTLTQQQLQGGEFEVNIPVRDDNTVEERERFVARLELTPQSQNLGVVSLGQSEGEVTIIDNDGKCAYSLSRVLTYSLCHTYITV